MIPLRSSERTYSPATVTLFLILVNVLVFVFELMLPRCVWWKGVSANEFPFGVKLQELVGHVAHRAFCFGLCLLPSQAAQAIQRRRSRLA